MRGQTLNTHQQQITQKLGLCGWENTKTFVTPDSLAHFSRALIEALQTTDTVIITGGLGPTHDDLTLEYISRTLGIKLESNLKAKKWLIQRFRKIGKKVNNFQLKQVLLPEGAVPMENKFGTAPGVFLQWPADTEKSVIKNIFVLPGPPREMEPLLESEILPRLIQISADKTHSLSCNLLIPLVYESEIASKIAAELNGDDGFNIGIYPKVGMVQLHISKAYRKKTGAEKKFAKKISAITRKLKPLPVFENAKDFFELVQNLIQTAGYTVSTAESCTGGMIASQLTSMPGSSDFFKSGVVTYSNAEKVRQLQVEKERLETFGAVSFEIVAQMASSITKLSGSSFGISASGVAGPAGGSSYKPVGTVFIGVSDGKTTDSHHFLMTGNRGMIRTKTVIAAYVALYEKIKGVKYKIPCRVASKSFKSFPVSPKELRPTVKR
ncbi:MAG: nicotinamide-nucleotide amidohydrolase family protein [Candidatus Omnitrophica bacterium]|nr:nicotinamide-nucleotide amidohydrolase family protein [Candidatus Omnitrophota bacterium]